MNSLEFARTKTRPNLIRSIWSKSGTALRSLLNIANNRQQREISAATFERILDNLDCTGVVVIDQNHNCIYTSRGWRKLAAVDCADACDSDWLEAIHVNDRSRVTTGFDNAIQQHTVFHAECRLQPAGGQQRWVSCRTQPIFNDNNKFIACLGSFTDITESRQASASLLRLSFYDTLTRLPNRSLLMHRLHELLNESPKQDNHLALIFIDLDGFKLINDTLGHELGDRLILEISYRLADCLAPGDTLARLGSDEFTAVIHCADNPALAEKAARRIMAAVKEPVTINDETVYVTASIGIAFSKKGISADGLIRQADIAMYDAKKTTSNTAQYYNRRLTADNRARLTVSSLLHSALSQNEFKVHYQPQLDIQSNTIVGSEALLRWHNPEVGTISPSVFIPLLEERGLINQVGEWVLSQSCQMQSKWHCEYPQHLTTISVNVSSIQLHDRTFLRKLKDILESSGLQPECLVLELTESILLDDYVGDSRLLHEISALGVKLALDDFGTGYGSFSYLKKHPIDHIKIDRSFIDNLFACDKNKAITTSIIDLSHKLGKTVVAEGVDSHEELNFLTMHKCDIYQGFLSSRAIPAADFARKYLTSQHVREYTAA
ncbi:hypothetical protein AB833_27190 [Chromatiales bacterium (ex Bugula neritina AB1)]|nr:hypothetical protein AB833_27190 [Chromatiales bacterium (ex Bugula neritina AB1)]